MSANTSTRTVTLTGRPPVSIDEAEWPIVARAHESVETRNSTPLPSYECARWHLVARQHADGRAIVYGVADPPSPGWPTHGCHDWRGGELLPAGSTVDTIVDAIVRVGADLVSLGGAPDESIVRDAIADLPPEAL